MLTPLAASKGGEGNGLEVVIGSAYGETKERSLSTLGGPVL